MRSQNPRVLLELVAAGPGKVIVEGLIDRVPNLDPTHFLLEILLVVVLTTIARVLNLRSDRSDCISAFDRPFNGVTLTFRKFEFFHGGLSSVVANFAADWLLNVRVVEVDSTFVVVVRNRVDLLAAILLIDGDEEPATVTQAKGLQLLLLR